MKINYSTSKGVRILPLAILLSVEINVNLVVVGCHENIKIPWSIAIKINPYWDVFLANRMTYYFTLMYAV